MYKALPQADWVIFEEVKDDDLEKQGSLYIPGGSEDLPMKKGKVLILGPKASENTEAAVGDLVLYHKKIGIPFILNGKKFYMTKAENFYVIIKEVEEEKE